MAGALICVWSKPGPCMDAGARLLEVAMDPEDDEGPHFLLWLCDRHSGIVAGYWEAMKEPQK